MAKELYLYMPAGQGRGGVARLGTPDGLAAHLREIRLSIQWKEAAGGDEPACMPIFAFGGLGVDAAEAERRARAAGKAFDPSRTQAMDEDDALLLFGASRLSCCEPGAEGMQTALEGRSLAFEMPMGRHGMASCRISLDDLHRALAEAQAKAPDGKRRAA